MIQAQPVNAVCTQPALLAGLAVRIPGPVVREERPIQQATVHRTNLQGLLRAQDGKFVGLDFIKVDGTVRSLNGRLGVRKHLAGGTTGVTGLDRPYLVVYDLKAKGYRAVNLATVSVLRARNTKYTVVG